MRLGTVLLLIAPLLASCGSIRCIGYMDSRNQGVTTRYSPYYELEQEFKEAGLLTRLVISLDQSRIPKDYPQAKDLVSHCGDDIVPWVSEIYFINASSEATTVEPLNLRVGGDSKSFSGSATIEPKKWFITEPLLAAHSNFGTQTKASFEFMHKGNVLKVEGTAKRLTMEELEAKYKPK